MSGAPELNTKDRCPIVWRYTGSFPPMANTHGKKPSMDNNCKMLRCIWEHSALSTQQASDEAICACGLLRSKNSFQAN